MPADTPLGRAKANATGLVSMLVTGIWLVGLFTGQGWWLPFMLFGYIVLVPVTAILFGDEDDRSEWVDDYTPGETTTSQSTSETENERTGDALQTLRDRYARGELTEAQFERKLEQLLETETVEDAVEYTSANSRSGNAGGSTSAGRSSEDLDDEFGSERA